jgi:hypothetical protein
VHIAEMEGMHSIDHGKIFSENHLFGGIMKTLLKNIFIHFQNM